MMSASYYFLLILVGLFDLWNAWRFWKRQFLQWYRLIIFYFVLQGVDITICELALVFKIRVVPQIVRGPRGIVRKTLNFFQENKSDNHETDKWNIILCYRMVKAPTRALKLTFLIIKYRRMHYKLILDIFNIEGWSDDIRHDPKVFWKHISLAAADC